MDTKIEERERLETKREFRYGLMRAARVSGHFIFWAGILAVFLGLMYSLLSLPNVLVWVFSGGKFLGPLELGRGFASPFSQLFVGTIILVGGFAGIALGYAIYSPYMLVKEMPTSYVRVCHHCGQPLKNDWIIFKCQECGGIFPLSITTFLARLISQGVTFIHWTIIITIVAFLFR